MRSFHVYSRKEGAYRVTEADSVDLEKRAIVIESISCIASKTLDQSSYVAALLEGNRDLLEIVDLNTAQHTQYTDQKMANTTMFNAVIGLESEEKERVIELYRKAFREGFSLNNPKICCIDHIFCDLVKNQVIP